ncbi:MAG: transporter [Clostridiales bacterium]|jgi:competence protein ComEA|nr:transporter [Clostridiales bacterium]
MLQLDKHQNKVLLAMVTVLALLTGVYVFRNLGVLGIGNDDVIQENRQNDLVINARTENETEMPDDTDDLEGKESSGKIDEPPGRIKVYITGQVKNPGVIEVDEGSRLIDVIELAGGALENADLNRVNLAVRVKDEGMYYIPEIGEEIEERNINGIAGNDPAGSSSGTGQKININTADEAMLDTLPGIGPSKARGIIEYRNQNGPFQSIEEIKNVPGIGEKTFEQLKDLIAVE